MNTLIKFVRVRHKIRDARGAPGFVRAKNSGVQSGGKVPPKYLFNHPQAAHNNHTRDSEAIEAC
ncbi:MAG TPA: hypothetical protein VHV82_14700 [Sporichthyaceae bacterium]|nr:hypothetical protein [Sporichthyaceae bacterium]